LSGVGGGGECDRDFGKVLVWIAETVVIDAPAHTSVCVLDSVT
jgi:hypothetical protein